MALCELCHQPVSCIAWLAQELFTFEAHNNSTKLRIVADAVAAENWFAADDLLEQLAVFNVLCQSYAVNRNTLHLCSGWTTGPHACHVMLTLSSMSGRVSILGVLEADILLFHPPQALLAHAVQTAQEVGVFQLTSALHTEEGGLSGTTLFLLLVRLGAPLWSRQFRWTTAGSHSQCLTDVDNATQFCQLCKCFVRLLPGSDSECPCYRQPRVLDYSKLPLVCCRDTV